jgi:hypothetical protein
MSNLSLEEFKEYLFHKRVPEGREIIWETESTAEQINTTLPNENTDFIEWAYENRQWIPTIGLHHLKSYFLSLIYTPYDSEMTDITTEIPPPEESDGVISLNNNALQPRMEEESDEDDMYFENEFRYSESDIMELFSALLKNATVSEEEGVSANMEVD